MKNNEVKEVATILREDGFEKAADSVERRFGTGPDHDKGEDLRETITRIREAGFARVADVLEKASDHKRGDTERKSWGRKK